MTPQRAAFVSDSEDRRMLWWDVVSKEGWGEVKAHNGAVLGVHTP